MSPPAIPPTRVFMLDIETAGHLPGNAILEMAAAEFCPKTGAIRREWGTCIDLLDSLAHGMTTDAETAAWHLRRGYDGSLRGATLFRAVNALDVFLHLDGGDCTLWAWGIDFERKMLEAAADAAKLPCPWKFWESRCARTVWKLAFPGASPPPRHHRAAADVRAQITDLLTAFHGMGLTFP